MDCVPEFVHWILSLVQRKLPEGKKWWCLFTVFVMAGRPRSAG